MKKIVTVILALSLLFAALPCASAVKAVEVSTSAEAFVLYCADNGEIVYSKNENKRMKPASTTKLLTTLITLEEAAASNKRVKFTEKMTAEGSSMYLKAGEVVTLKDLAAGMMMASGNDAANAAAVTISGSSEKFAERMNESAKLIGMKSSHFVTPSGLDDDNHYTTALDMALLMSYALENEDFAKLTSQKSAAVDFIEPQSKKTVYANHNRLLSLYPYCTGGKTGYTKAAGRCLVSSAKKDGLTLVCVTLNDRNDWNDHISLYDKGFSKLACRNFNETEFFADIPCVGGEQDSVTVTGESDVCIVVAYDDKDKIKRTVYADSFLYAPIGKNSEVGRIEYTLNGKCLKTVRLLAVDKINSKKENKNIFTWIKELFTYGKK